MFDNFFVSQFLYKFCSVWLAHISIVYLTISVPLIAFITADVVVVAILLLLVVLAYDICVRNAQKYSHRYSMRSARNFFFFFFRSRRMEDTQKTQRSENNTEKMKNEWNSKTVYDKSTRKKYFLHITKIYEKQQQPTKDS